MKKSYRRFRSKGLPKDIVLKSEICHRYDLLVIGPRVEQFDEIGLVLRARPILKLLARLLPELYSTWSKQEPSPDYYY